MEILEDFEILAPLRSTSGMRVFLARRIGKGGPFRASGQEVLLCRFHMGADELWWRYVDESRLLDDIDHPNIHRLIAWGQREPFCVLESASGWSLEALLEHRRPLPPAAACSVARQLCQGLRVMHEMTDAEGRSLEAIYRLLEPGNVLVTPEGRVVLAHPSLAGLRHLVRVGAVRSGPTRAYAYLAPEQARGMPLDRRCDLFSLGVLLFELLAAEPLFWRERDLDTIHAVIECALPPTLAEMVPPALAALIERLVRVEPADRLGAAAEIDFALEFVELAAGYDDGPSQLLSHVEALGLRDQPLTFGCGFEPQL